MAEPLPVLKMKSSELKKLAQDPVAAARAVKLVYVNSSDEGISRIKAGKGFSYKYQDKTIKDKAELKRIHALVLPPAWEEVWICAIPNGHLQATGKDAMKRKQYRYHPLWNACRNETKFFRLLALGKLMPAIREQLRKDLALPGMPLNKVLAVVVSLMEKTGIRIGNEFYENLYGSFGLTTLKDKHVSIKGGAIRFCFRGKKGVEHQVSLHSKKLAKIVQHCRDIPGKELFQYYDEEGKRQSIESGMVNEYIKNIAGDEFTAKDLRTWCGSVAALQAFKEAGGFESETEAKKKIIEALDKVSTQLGNSRTVCKKYYVHPCLPDLYEKGELDQWIGKDKRSKKENDIGLEPEEKLLIKILESNNK